MSKGSNISIKRLIVTGRVQGVGYRASAYYAAQRLQLKGWVRNLRSGQVEAVVQGSPERIEEFIAWAHRGPDAARVETVEVCESSGDFSQFEIRDTA